MTTMIENRVNVREAVVFGRGGGRELRCDIYEPPSPIRNGIGVLLVHGGGWSGGDRTQLKGYGILLGRKGYLCVASEYRLTGEALWPAQIEDVKAALRWMRANAGELGIDPSRIVIEGNSAGAHLALVAGGTSRVAAFDGQGGNPGIDSSVAAVIAFYPPTGLEQRSWGGLPSLFGPGAAVETLRGASPLSYASRDYPPTLLFQGSADDIVPAGESTAMYDALTAARVPVELHIYAGQPHGFDADPRLGRQCAELMASFIERMIPA
ncbi:MAG: alpha/beta hydrolase fold domain-containing protein [Tepidiformaceae bacterium]